MEIPYKKLSIEIEAIDPLIMPTYKGSTIRGGFGNVFRRIVCAFKNKECSECMLNASCIYAYVFETHPGDGSHIMHMNKYEKVPHPFVIEPPLNEQRFYNPGDIFTVGLVLIGDATDYVPYFIYTFVELGKAGIGKGRGKFKLRNVSEDGKEIYSHKTEMIKATDSSSLHIPENLTATESNNLKKGTLKLRFITPVRILYNRKLTSHLEFHVLMRQLLRRIALLYYFHCGKNSPVWDHKAILQKAESVVVKENNLKWHDWERYSARQQVRMKLGGLVGDVVYSGSVLPFLPYVKAGEIFHVGKGTSFGLGKYEVELL